MLNAAYANSPSLLRLRDLVKWELFRCKDRKGCCINDQEIASIIIARIVVTTYVPNIPSPYQKKHKEHRESWHPSRAGLEKCGRVSALHCTEEDEGGMISGPDRADQPRGFHAPPRERGRGGDLPGLGCSSCGAENPKAWQKSKEAKGKRKRAGVVWCGVWCGVLWTCPPHSSLGPGGLFLASHGRRRADAGETSPRGVYVAGDLSRWL